MNNKIHLLNQPEKKKEFELQCDCGSKVFNFKNINGNYYIICPDCKRKSRLGIAYKILLVDDNKDKVN